MPAVLHTLPPSARVLVVRIRSLGDCVLTTPALRLMKTARPDLRVAVMVEPRFAAVFEGNPDVEAISAPGPGRAFSWRPALTLNLHGGPRSAALTAASMAGLRAGFGHYRFQALYNLRIPRAQAILGEERTVHTAEHLASAMFYLGAPVATPIDPRHRLVTTKYNPARTWTPHGSLHASFTARAMTAMTATISGPTSPRR